MPLVTTKGNTLDVSTQAGNPLLVELSSITTEDKVVTITYPHHEIHEGNHYVAGYVVELANGASIRFVFVTPNTDVEPHAIIGAVSELEMEGTLYEGVTYDAPGTALAAINRNRRSSNTATMLVYHTPTNPSTAAATALQSMHWGSGKSNGGDVRGAEEFILKKNTRYMVLFTNQTTSNNYLTFYVDWYEHND